MTITAERRRPGLRDPTRGSDEGACTTPTGIRRSQSGIVGDEVVVSGNRGMLNMDIDIMHSRLTGVQLEAPRQDGSLCRKIVEC